METIGKPYSSNASTTSNTRGYSFPPLTEAEGYIATGKFTEAYQEVLIQNGDFAPIAENK